MSVTTGGIARTTKDRRCLVNTFSDFYNPKILNDEHKFSPSSVYYVPPEVTLTLASTIRRPRCHSSNDALSL
jgi:hypothetical protein